MSCTGFDLGSFLMMLAEHGVGTVLSFIPAVWYVRHKLRDRRGGLL